jgi:hypothetical protein
MKTTPDYPEGSQGDTSNGAARPYQYPRCLSFQHWAFPHGKLPPLWRTQDSPPVGLPKDRSNIAHVTRDRDNNRCIILPNSDYVHSAHLVPQERWQWFDREEQEQYVEQGNADQAIDAMANRVTLQPDLHATFDLLKWTFPYKVGRWVAHFIRPTVVHGTEFHELVVVMADDVAPELLLARFVLAILGQVRVGSMAQLRLPLLLHCSMVSSFKACIFSTISLSLLSFFLSLIMSSSFSFFSSSSRSSHPFILRHHPPPPLHL